MMRFLAALKRHPVLGNIGSFLMTRAAFNGDPWAQLGVLAIFGSWLDKRKLDRAKQAASDAAEASAAACTKEPAECVADAKQAAIKAGTAYMRGGIAAPIMSTRTQNVVAFVLAVIVFAIIVVNTIASAPRP